MSTSNLKNIIIGIDPAFRKQGFSLAIIDIDRSVRFINLKEPEHFIGWFLHESPEVAKIAVENSYLQKKVWRVKGYDSPFAAAEKGRKVGLNQGISEMTVRLCISKYGAENVLNHSPQQKGAKWVNDSFVKGVARAYELKIDKKKLSQDDRDSFKMAILFLQKLVG